MSTTPSHTGPRLPRLKRTLELIRPNSRELRLRSAEKEITIDDPPRWAESFMRALDGRRELPEIAATLRAAGAHVALSDLRAALSQLDALGLLDDAVDDRLLSDTARERYDRQLRYFSERGGTGESAVRRQLRLGEATVVVLGLGALGGIVAHQLAAAGVGTIVAVDGDTVELSNLNRQMLYSETDIGRAKTDVAAERIRTLNSQISFRAVPQWLEGPSDVTAAVEGSDFVVDAVDSPPHEIERWVNDACFGLGIPYIGMSHYPPWIRVGPTYVPGETGCYRCQELEWRARDPLFDVRSAREPAALAPTATAVGGLVAMETVHYLTSLSAPATVGVSVMIDIATLSIERRVVTRRRGCTVCRSSSVNARPR
jgi:bacteriocin biosynthesis cyclodehydratase domain-containing protein